MMVVPRIEGEILLVYSLKHGSEGEPELWITQIRNLETLPVRIVLVPGRELQPSEGSGSNRVVYVPVLEHPPVE